jgi:hypothetical protein
VEQPGGGPGRLSVNPGWQVHRHAVDSEAFRIQVRRELDTFEACLDADLSVPIEHCGDWTLHDLADHLGRGNLWSAAAITEQRGDYV